MCRVGSAAGRRRRRCRAIIEKPAGVGVWQKHAVILERGWERKIDGPFSPFPKVFPNV